MVFKKMTDEQKQFLFDLRETTSKADIASMRALIMRGIGTEDAKKTVAERAKAKEEYLKQVEKELVPVTAPEKKAKAKPKQETVVEEKPARKSKAKAAPAQVKDPEPVLPAIENVPKPRKRPATSPAAEN